MGWVQRVIFACAGLLPVLVTVFAFPVVLLARHNQAIGQLYYWLIFAVSEFLCLSRADHFVRSVLFQPMKQDLESKRAVGLQGFKVLEIGPGTGGNFAYYPPGVQLTTLEVNPLLEKHASRIKRQHPHVQLEKSLIGDAECMHCFPNESFDAVVGTHILCCIRDPEAAIAEIRRVLKQVCHEV